MIKEGLVPVHQAGLRRNCLSFIEVVAQSVANIAPSATPALIIPAVFSITGRGLWFTYAFSTVALLFVTYHINQFAKRSASPGALYTFVAQGMGPAWGVISGWSLVIAYLITGAATLCECGHRDATFYRSHRRGHVRGDARLLGTRLSRHRAVDEVHAPA